MSEIKQRAGDITREREPFQQIVAAFQGWLSNNVGAENVRFYVWDRALGHSLSVWDNPGERGFEAGFDRALASLVDLALVTGEGRVLDPLRKDPVLGPLAPKHLSAIIVLPYIAATGPLGALAFFNVQQRSLDTCRAALDLLAAPTLLALRSFFELRSATIQNQELQRSRDNLASLLKEVEQRRLAIEHLTQEIEQRAKEQEALRAIASAASESLHIYEMLQNALDKVLQVTGRERGTIRLKDPATGEILLSAHRGFSEAEIEILRRNVPHQISEQIFASGQPVVVNDRKDLRNSQSLLPQSRSVAWIPIKARQNVVGVLGVSAGRPVPFAPREVDLLQAVGNVIGVAVENAWLFEETQRQEEIQRLLKELSQDITSLDINALFQKVADKVREFFKVDISDIRLLQESGTRRLAGSSGIAPDILYNPEASMGRSRWIVSNRRPLVIPDMTKETGVSAEDTVRKLGIRGYLAVPLFSRSGEVIGILRAFTYEPREFSRSEVDLFQQLANGTAIALTNARLFEETEQRAHEQEVLNAIATATSQSLRLDELLRIALDKVLEATGRDQGYIRLKDPLTGNLTLVAHRGISEKFVETLLYQRTPGGKSDQVFESGELLVIDDTECAELKKETLREGCRSMSWFPLKVRGTAVGIMNVSTTRYLPFQPREVELLKAIGNVIGVALENARLFEKTERNLERIRALREIDQAITSSLDLRTVLDVLMEKIDLVLPYSAVTVRLFEKESGLLEPVACRNLEEAEWKESKWRGGRGIANVVFETRAPLIIRNCQDDSRVLDMDFYRKHKLTSYVGVPLIVKDEVLGVLGFYTKEQHEFSGEEVDFLSTLAARAAIAIHNARLHEETERRRREGEELARVAQSLTETLDMAAVGERIVTSIRELFGVRASMLRLLQADGSLRAIASSGQVFLQDFGGDVLPVGMGLAGRAVAEGRPIWSADVLNDPETHLTDQMRDYQVRSGNRSMIAVPLRAHERIVGSLGLSDQTGRVYSDSEVALVQTFADQAALALENARLYKEAQIRETQLQETNRMISALHAVAAAASQSLDLNRVLRAVIEKITEIFRLDATQIHIYNERTDELVLGAYLERSANLFVSVKSFRRGQGIVGKVAERGQPLIFEDVDADPLYSQLSHTKASSRFGFRFFAVFPIRGKLKNLGTLACTGMEPRKLNSGEVQLLEAMADQIAVAIENSELYEQVRQKVQELQQKTAELERANKVKDEFLSVMSHELRTPLNVVAGYAGVIREGMLGDTTPKQAQALAKIMNRTNDLFGMITSMLYATSIMANEVRVESHPFALTAFLDELKRHQQGRLRETILMDWDYPSDSPVMISDREKLKYILQAIIDNAVKFTEQGRVTISARIRDQGLGADSNPQFPISNSGFVEFMVADTGIGIPEEKLPIIFEKFRQADSSETRSYGGVGLGLYIAKNFSELLGGKIEVETGEGKGSTFTVRIPFVIYASSKGDQKEETPEGASQEQNISAMRHGSAH